MAGQAVPYLECYWGVQEQLAAQSHGLEPRRYCEPERESDNNGPAPCLLTSCTLGIINIFSVPVKFAEAAGRPINSSGEQDTPSTWKKSVKNGLAYVLLTSRNS